MIGCRLKQKVSGGTAGRTRLYQSPDAFYQGPRLLPIEQEKTEVTELPSKASVHSVPSCRNEFSPFVKKHEEFDIRSVLGPAMAVVQEASSKSNPSRHEAELPFPHQTHNNLWRLVGRDGPPSVPFDVGR